MAIPAIPASSSPPPPIDVHAEPPKVRMLEYPSGAVHVQEARHATVEMITGSPSVPDEIADIAALVVSELATNAVQHGTGALRLDLIVVPGSRCRATTFRVEISDENEAEPVLQGIAPDPDPEDLLAESGRGLGLVHELAHHCGVEPRACGKTVWAQWEWPAE